MYRKFIAPEINRPFTLYFRSYREKIRGLKFTEIKFSGEFADCFGGEGIYGNTHHFFLDEVVKITYTYYDWLKKRKVNQVIYKTIKRGNTQ